MPGVLRRPLPCTRADGAESFRNCVKNQDVGFATLLELPPRHAVDRAIGTSIKNAIRIENGDPELALELLEQSKHSIDRAA